MEAHLETDFLTGRVDVYLFQRGPRGDHLWQYRSVNGEPMLVAEPIEPAARAESPTFSLPQEALDAIVAAMRPRTVVDDVTLESIEDARAIRDRLLGLVEQLALAPA